MISTLGMNAGRTLGLRRLQNPGMKAMAPVRIHPVRSLQVESVAVVGEYTRDHSRTLIQVLQDMCCSQEFSPTAG